MDKKFLEEFSNVLKDFFKTYGGYSNGYETQLDGMIRKNVRARIAWQTPERYTMTYKDADIAAGQLYDALYAICEKYNIFDIIIYSVHIEYDCYNIYIEQRIKERFIFNA